MDIMNTTLECDIKDPLCFSATTAVPWETDYAALVPRFTGSLSAISSTLTIYVILRSQTRLSSIYHRIMFGMSLADICGSIAMALTSLPMPSYMPKEEIFGYKWAGTRLGNTYTCNAQGFFVFFGMGCMFNYNAMLCVYYVCAIAFTMRERNIKKYVEPILHGIPLLAGLSFSLPPLFYDMYNPSVSAYAWCGPVPYPNECSVYTNDVECIRGDARMAKVVGVIIVVVILCVFCIIVLSLGLVIWKVVQTDKMIEQISKLYKNCGHGRDMTKIVEKHRNTKAVVIQAVSYITAFLLGVLPPFLLVVGAVNTSGNSQLKAVDFFEKLTLVFLPLQGFLNCIIFMSHKVHNYRRVRRDVSIGRVIALLFCTFAHDPCFISRISIVLQEQEDKAGNECGDWKEFMENKQHRQGYDLDINDESNDELHYRLGLINYNPDALICAEGACNDEESSSADTSSQRDEDALLSTNKSQEGDDKSCNDPSSLPPFSSSSSFTSNSLWEKNLSVDEGLMTTF